MKASLSQNPQSIRIIESLTETLPEREKAVAVSILATTMETLDDRLGRLAPQVVLSIMTSYIQDNVITATPKVIAKALIAWLASDDPDATIDPDQQDRLAYLLASFANQFRAARQDLFK